MAAGLIGAGLVLVVHGVQHLAFGYAEGTFVVGVELAPPWRRLAGVAAGGLVIGLAWWQLRTRSRLTGVSQVVRDPSLAMPVWPTLADALTQVVGVGAGMSVGREQAPRQAAGAVADVVGRRLSIAPHDRAVVVGCAAGAALAAVYNVPATGAIFALQLIGWTWRRVVAAVGVSAVATIVAWPVVTWDPTYPFPAVSVDPATFAWALPVIAGAFAGGGVLAVLLRWARKLRPEPRLVWITVPAVGVALGAALWWLPELAGNGKGILQLAFAGGSPLVLFAVLALAKPLATAACLGAGVEGGTLTPSLATGGAVGASVALAAGLPSQVAALTLLGAAVSLTVTHRSPLFAAAFAIELTHPSWQVMLLVCAGSLVAHVLVRFVVRIRRGRGDPAPGS